MPILIDGYNLLNLANIVVEEGGKYTLEKSRRAVLRFVMALVPSSELSRTTVVFDGREAPPGLPASGKFGPIQVRFSRRGTEADDLIESMLPTYSNPKSLVVVSSDHRIQRAARRRGARGVDSEVWANQMITRRRSSRKKHKPADPGAAAKVKLTATELAVWLNEFSEIDVEEIELEVSSENQSSSAAHTGSKDPNDDPKEETEDTNDLDDEELMDEKPFNPFPPGYGEDLL